jgi:hypothetical protein
MDCRLDALYGRLIYDIDDRQEDDVDFALLARFQRLRGDRLERMGPCAGVPSAEDKQTVSPPASGATTASLASGVMFPASDTASWGRSEL